jgi:hypothetical protein
MHSQEMDKIKMMKVVIVMKNKIRLRKNKFKKKIKIRNCKLNKPEINLGK